MLILMSTMDPQPPRYADIPVTLGCLPFYHSYGLSAFCFRAFAVPCTAIITPRWDVSHALKLIPKYASRLQIPSVTNTIIKMEGNRVATCTIDDPPIGEFPRLGRDGYK